MKNLLEIWKNWTFSRVSRSPPVAWAQLLRPHNPHHLWSTSICPNAPQPQTPNSDFANKTMFTCFKAIRTLVSHFGSQCCFRLHTMWRDFKRFSRFWHNPPMAQENWPSSMGVGFSVGTGNSSANMRVGCKYLASLCAKKMHQPTDTQPVPRRDGKANMFWQLKPTHISLLTWPHACCKKRIETVLPGWECSKPFLSG